MSRSLQAEELEERHPGRAHSMCKDPTGRGWSGRSTAYVEVGGGEERGMLQANLAPFCEGL